MSDGIAPPATNYKVNMFFLRKPGAVGRIAKHRAAIGVKQALVLSVRCRRKFPLSFIVQFYAPFLGICEMKQPHAIFQ